MTSGGPVRRDDGVDGWCCRGGGGSRDRVLVRTWELQAGKNLQVSGWNLVGGGTTNSDKEHGSQLKMSLVWDTPISTDSVATGVGGVQLRARWTSLELRVGAGLEPEILELTPGNYEGNKLLGRVL